MPTKTAPARRARPAAPQPMIPPLDALAHQENLRRVALARLRRLGGDPMATSRIGLAVKDWQLSILKELARDRGFKHVATFVEHELVQLYPALKRPPAPDSRQVELLQDTAKGTGRAVARASAAARS